MSAREQALVAGLRALVEGRQAGPEARKRARAISTIRDADLSRLPTDVLVEMAAMARREQGDGASERGEP